MPAFAILFVLSAWKAVYWCRINQWVAGACLHGVQRPQFRNALLYHILDVASLADIRNRRARFPAHSLDLSDHIITGL